MQDPGLPQSPPLSPAFRPNTCAHAFTCTDAGWGLLGQHVPGGRMEAQPQPPLPCSALGSSGALSLPGPPGSRNKTAVPVWSGAQEPQGKQVPGSKLPSPDPTHARRVTGAEPQAGGATENRALCLHSRPSLPPATFPDPGVCCEVLGAI